MLNRFRNDLSVAALPQEMDAAANRTIAHLQSGGRDASRCRASGFSDGRLDAAVSVENLGGHKLPTAYPSRRAWLHVTVRDRERTGGVRVRRARHRRLHSAATTTTRTPRRFEPHYTEITRPDQVQIYESVMAGADGGADDRAADARCAT